LSILPVINEALTEADVGWDDLAAVAVTHGPGLAGSLLVGVNAAKGLAWGRGLPLIGINHIEAHIYGNWLVDAPPPEFPLVCLVVSGGHTELILMTDHGQYRRLGGTLDDAAGEAFDKVGRLLGLSYPGGPAIQEAARAGTPTAFKLPRAWLPGSYDFSFSGLKTAVLRVVQKYQPQANGQSVSKPRAVSSQTPPMIRIVPVANLAASFQAAVVDVLVEKTCQAAEEFRAKMVLLAGGVAANETLRAGLSQRSPVPVRYPPLEFCTDNAAMVASAGFFRFEAGEQAGWELDVMPSLRLIGESNT
jgi:N6-L-threonylcarbamoyladenine synthase